MTHFPLLPGAAEAACGAEPAKQTTELDLVTCSACRLVVLRREILGAAA